MMEKSFLLLIVLVMLVASALREVADIKGLDAIAAHAVEILAFLA